MKKNICLILMYIEHLIYNTNDENTNKIKIKIHK